MSERQLFFKSRIEREDILKTGLLSGRAVFLLKRWYKIEDGRS